MFMGFYSRKFGFGANFDYQLANGIVNFMPRLQRDQNDIRIVALNGKIVDAIYIGGKYHRPNKDWLRAFIVNDKIRPRGFGRRLVAEAV